MVYNPNKFCSGKITFLHTHHRICQAALPVPGQAMAALQYWSYSGVLCFLTFAFCILSLYLPPETKFWIPVEKNGHKSFRNAYKKYPRKKGYNLLNFLWGNLRSNLILSQSQPNKDTGLSVTGIGDQIALHKVSLFQKTTDWRRHNKLPGLHAELYQLIFRE